jgi:hypothetical protein
LLNEIWVLAADTAKSSTSLVAPAESVAVLSMEEYFFEALPAMPVS